MNIKALMQPLSEKINSLIELLDEMVTSMKEQKEIQKEILMELKDLADDANKKHICKVDSVAKGVEKADN